MCVMLLSCTTLGGRSVLSQGSTSQVHNGRSRVQSAQRAARLLDLLAEQGAGTSQQLGEAAGLDRTIAHRLLKTLESCGLAVQVGSAWELGPSILGLGMAYLERHPFPVTARPYGIDLQRKVVADRPWVVSLGMPVGNEVVLVEQFWGPGSPLDIIHSIGKRLSMTRSATGLAILSALDESEAIARVGEEQYEEVRHLLGEIRANDGLYISTGMVSSGVSAAATAVRDATGRPVGSINISGIDLEDELSYDSDLSLRLLRTAASISVAL